MPRGERPLDAEDTELGSFAAGLRRLREKAGGPAYRELAARAHYSPATLSDAAGGRKLPTLAVTLAYVSACGGDTGEWEQRWRDIAAPPAESGEAPYVGLAAFQREDSDRFFGREALTARLVELVGRRPFVGVFGASGSGKSSLLRAGLAARLDHVMVLTPGVRPADECAVRLARLTGESAAQLRAELSDPSALALRLAQHHPDLVLVVDQFEEVFTLADAASRDWFVQALVRVPHVVLGVRADFYGHIGHHPELARALEGNQLLVGPMTTDELRRAITEPALRVGAQVESALVTRLVADVAGQQAALPLVSHVLVETWHRRRGMTLSLAGYESAGGVAHAVARTAESVFEDLTPPQQVIARQIFLRLIALGDGTDDTKRRIRRGDLDDEVLERLAAARLVILDADAVELAHEVLIRSWPRLRDWLAEDRAGLLAHHQLTEAAATWEALGRDDDALYRGVRLAHVRSLPPESLTPVEREFLLGSIGMETARHVTRRRRARRTRVLLSVLTVLVVVLAGTVIYAAGTAREVTRQRNAVLVRQAGVEVSTLIASDPRRAARVALAADALAAGEESRDAVLTAGAAHRKLQLASLQSARIPSFDVSPDGRFVMSENPGIRVVDSMTGTETSPPPLKEALSAGFSGDEQRIFVLPPAGGTEAWDLASSTRLAVLPHRLWIGNASRSGEILVGRVADSGPAEVWSFRDLGRPRALAVPSDLVSRMSVGSDGSVLAVLRSDPVTLELWRLDGDQPRLVSTSAQPGVHFTVLEISGDGRFLALWNRTAKQVVVWDVSDPAAPSKWATLPETSSNRVQVRFAADGRSVAVAVDTAVQVWNIERRDAPARLVTFAGFVGQPAAVGYRQSDDVFLVVDQDATAWPLRTDLGTVRAELCEKAERPSAEEWMRYFAGVERVPICEQQVS